MAQPLQYDFVNEVITVPLPDTTLDLQYLVNQTRDQEDNAEPGMAYGTVLQAFGKQDLGGGVSVGITVVLLDNWAIKFADRTGPGTVSVRISGGNLVGDAGHNPVAPSEFTQVTLANSSSATIANSTAGTNLSDTDLANISTKVWEEVISNHTQVAGSAAKTLKDTKTKATLASLK